MEIEWLRIIGAAFGFGIILGAGWIAAYFLSWCWAWTWAWVDDSKAPKKNPLINLAMSRMGWGEGDWLWSYKKGSHNSDGGRGFFFPLIALILLPPFISSAIAVYPITLAVFLAYLIARLARFARRHKKLFDKHLKDPEAHK
jgi:hypothetical protein